MWAPEAWRNWEGRSRCRLFEIHGLTACNVSGDWLHAKYLGSDLVAFGSILWLWAFVLGPGNETENMKIFDTFLKGFYRQHRTSSSSCPLACSATRQASSSRASESTGLASLAVLAAEAQSQCRSKSSLTRSAREDPSSAPCEDVHRSAPARTKTPPHYHKCRVGFLARDL